MRKYLKAAQNVVVIGIVFMVIGLLHRAVFVRTIANPNLNLLETQENRIILKNTEKVSFGFLPYWTINSYVPDYSSLTDIAYFGFFLNPNGTIKKLDSDGNTDPSYNNWRNNEKLHSILREGKRHNVRPNITIALHEPDEIEYFLNCGTTCWHTNYEEISSEVAWGEIEGLNFDLEYPGEIPDGLDTKYTNYINYLSKKLKEDYGENFNITVSTFGFSASKVRLMNISDLNSSEYVDYIFIMAYDFHTRGSNTAGPVAPIDGAPEKYSYDLETMTKHYLEKAVSSKLILGVPFYGYNWIVSDYSPSSARLAGNYFTGYSISQFYDDIKEKIQNDNIQIQWDEEAKSPYFTYYNYETGAIRQVYYENEQSIEEKIKFAEKNNLAGIGIWALGYDGRNKELTNLFKNYLLLNKDVAIRKE